MTEEVKAKDESKPEESSTTKKEDGIQKRIDELTKIRRETERDRDYRKELATQKQPKPKTVEAGMDVAPY